MPRDTEAKPAKPAKPAKKGPDGHEYQAIDPEAAVEAFVRERTVAAAFDVLLADLNVAQTEILKADPDSPVGDAAVAAMTEDRNEKRAKRDRLNAKTADDFDPAEEAAARFDAWKAERPAQLERERAALAWLRDNPDDDDDDVDRAEQVRQVDAAIAVLG